MVGEAGLCPGDPVECGGCPCGREGRLFVKQSLLFRGKPPVILYCRGVNSDEKQPHSEFDGTALGEDSSKMTGLSFRG